MVHVLPPQNKAIKKVAAFIFGRFKQVVFAMF